MRIRITENYLNTLLLHYTEKYRRSGSKMRKTIFAENSSHVNRGGRYLDGSCQKVLSKGISDFYLDKMPDIFTKEKRSKIMSQIRSKGTTIELKMKAALEEAGIEFEYQPKMFGKPDFLVPPKIVIFCDSSFWHGRHWNKLKKQLPKQYWRDHIQRNIERDRIVNKTLKKKGYIVLRFWDDRIQTEIGKCTEEIKKVIRSLTVTARSQENPSELRSVTK